MREKIEEIFGGAEHFAIITPADKTKELEIFFFECVSSTNKIARAYAEHCIQDCTVPILLVANSQSDGRGRMGRSFYSPEDTGLYMTLLLKAPHDSAFALLTALSAVAVSDAVYSELGQSVDIKWVNDLYKNGKKVAGILAESFVCREQRFVAIGVGINISTKCFPEELVEKAGTLLCCGAVDRDVKISLAKKISKNLLCALYSEDKTEYMNKYRERSMVLGKEIEFLQNGKIQKGRAVAIDQAGALEVSLGDGRVIKLSTGEVSIFLDNFEK